MKRILAVDCGATASRAGLYDEDHVLVAEAAGGPSNPSERGVDYCIGVLADLGRKLLGSAAPVDGVAAGMAGAGGPRIRLAVAQGICKSLGAKRAWISDDRWPLLEANAGKGKGIVVIAGTGSSVLARSEDGRTLCIGGRGRLLDDEGSAFQLGLRGLRASNRAVDRTGPQTALLFEVLRATDCGDINELDFWALHAAKEDIARLAHVVTKCAENQDKVALACVRNEAAALARQILAALESLSLPEDTPVYFHGGLVKGAMIFQEAFLNKVHEAKPGLSVKPALLAGHRAVLEMAVHYRPSEFVSLCEDVKKGDTPLPPTESRLEGKGFLDRMSALEIVRCMNQEDARVAGALAREEASIAKAVEMAARAFSEGGRIIYVGAGTSGRLGVLDASECPPTFGVPPGRFIGIMAGGEAALCRSMEGAEDNSAQAVKDLAALDPPLSAKDLLIGITASGTTPYVLAALAEGRQRGVDTVLITGNPDCEKSISLVIILDTGPEVLAGSTRLKAGTAAKMVLNMISTGAMSLSGHMYDGWMVGLEPSCAKLRRRALHIVRSLTGKDENSAETLLEEAGGRVPVAVLMAKKGLDLEGAAALLKKSGGSLRSALAKE